MNAALELTFNNFPAKSLFSLSSIDLSRPFEIEEITNKDHSTSFIRVGIANNVVINSLLVSDGISVTINQSVYVKDNIIETLSKSSEDASKFAGTFTRRALGSGLH